MIIHIVKNTVKPGKTEEYVQVALDFMAYVKEHDAGCISARVMADTTNEHMIVNLLEWEDMASLEAHLAGGSLMKFVDRLEPCFAGNTTEIYELK